MTKKILLFPLLFASVSGFALAKPALATGGVPFYEQIIGSSWKDPIAADGCEEDAALMAEAWATGKNYSAADARAQIVAMANYEVQHFGFFEDASAADTARMLSDMYGVQTVLSYNISVIEIRAALARGNIVIIPINGQRLNNPHYTKPGPPRHMLVVTDYDPKTDRFIVNDPGTRFGHGERFSSPRIQDALEDYQTGNHITNTVIRTAMIEVSMLK